MGGRRRGRVVMVQGTASHAGKSLVTTALCRIFAQDGYSVAPFKAQNMALNSFVTPEGGEIGRSQATQAEAARVLPHVDMNPVLLKPEGNMTSQVIVLGKVFKRTQAREYYTLRPRLWPVVAGALDRLRREYEVVVIEGAGSPAEINLQRYEIVNMRVARYVKAPILLVADIERGGVFASLYGTVELLKPRERELVKAFVINKFRGDLAILDPGLRMITKRTGVPVAGVLPYLAENELPEEDSLGLPRQDGLRPSLSEDSEGRLATSSGLVLDIVVIALPHIANFDDFDPLAREAGVGVRFVRQATDLGTPDLIILPGSKTAVADLGWLRSSGLAARIVARRKGGTAVIGICGGYQMLGERILDPHGVESAERESVGLGLLPIETRFAQSKSTAQMQLRIADVPGLLAGCAGLEVSGYEIHMGDSVASEKQALAEKLPAGSGGWDGAVDAEGRTIGTYLHGLFHNDGLRRALLNRLAEWKGVQLPAMKPTGRDPIDCVAEMVRENLDMRLIYRITGLEERG